MTVKYVNYKGDTYYLYEKRNAAGKSKYYFSKSTDGNLVESIPENYEIYENPNGQVFSKMKFVLTDEEKRIFSVERMCYRSFVDGWLELYVQGEIEKLVKKYCYHLGRESFYDL